MKLKLLILIVAMTVLANPLIAKISESDLGRYRAAFLSKMLKDNPHQEKYIRACLHGIIPQGNAGMRLLDKLALFMYDMKQNKLNIQKTRFLYAKGTFIILLVLQDDEEQMYDLYLEYKYAWNNRCHLQDAYFSMIFSKKQKKILEFFGSR